MEVVTMGTTQQTRCGVTASRGYRIAGLCLIGLTFLPVSSLRAAVEFRTDIDVGIIHSDNIFLAPDGEEQDETVYTLAPLFIITSDESRFDADMRYRPQAYWYSENSDANDIFHTLDVVTETMLLEDRLFLDVNASRFQSIVAPENTIPGNNIPITSNREEAQIFDVSPYWRQDIGSSNLLIRAEYFNVDYENPDLQDSEEFGGSFEFGNLQRQRGFAWQVDYMKRRTEYDVSPPWEFQRASLNIGAWFNESFRLFAVGGGETAFDNFEESNLDADFWEVGFQYTPNSRLNLELAFGDRSYGTSARGELSYRLRRGNLSISYSEGPETLSDILRDRRPLESPGSLDGSLDRLGETDRFIRKRGDVSLTFELAKSELTFLAFSERREARTTAGGTDLGDERLLGGTLAWNWRMGSRTTLGITGDIAERESPGVEDTLYGLELEIAYQLSQRFTLLAQAARFSQDGQLEEFGYTENQYRLYLRSGF